MLEQVCVCIIKLVYVGKIMRMQILAQKMQKLGSKSLLYAS